MDVTGREDVMNVLEWMDGLVMVTDDVHMDPDLPVACSSCRVMDDVKCEIR